MPSPGAAEGFAGLPEALRAELPLSPESPLFPHALKAVPGIPCRP